MKIMHLSDLHVGKRLYGYSMLEDQAFIFDEIVRMAADERPDAALIAGDVYDKTTPSAEGVALFDEFLVRLREKTGAVLIISGNHDSAERVAFGGRLMTAGGVYLSPVYDGRIRPVRLRDDAGEVLFYLLPFVRPADLRPVFPDIEIKTLNDGMRAAIGALCVPENARTVLVAHQFVTGAAVSDSEDVFVGAAENVDAAVFDGFDYVALGHLHRPQSVGRETVRYCGTPLKYSFSESKDQKSVTMVELGKKGVVALRILPLTPRRDLRVLKGGFEQIMRASDAAPRDDYLQVILTDEDKIPDVVQKLKSVYPNLMCMDYDNQRTRALQQPILPSVQAGRSGTALFEELFERQNGRPMDEAQREICAAVFEKAKEAAL